jgi:hypothetical protein
VRNTLLVFGAGMVAACTATQSNTVPPPSDLQYHSLSSVERDTLHKSLSATLKDPDAAQFKWMPVVVPKGDASSVAYCGLVNRKNSYGGYGGFRKFYANLTRNADGQYVSGAVRSMESGSDDDVSDAMDRELTNICQRRGYADFSAAN